MIENLNDYGARCLCHAILAQAAYDYRNVMRHGDHGTVNRKELEMFFRSGMFHSMLGDFMSPKQFMDTARSMGRFQINKKAGVDV